jgi:hypothetical protein
MDLNTIQEKVYREYVRNGYKKMWNLTRSFKGQKIRDIAELSLVTTEVTEAIEEIRNRNTNIDNLGFECADIIIRTLNFMTRKGLNANNYIITKSKKNLLRKKLHNRDV